MSKFTAVLASSVSASNITPAPETTWLAVGNGADTLRAEIESFYWAGVKGEVENIVRTLKAWQEPPFASVSIPDENDDFIHGFDTFINQVSQEARVCAIRYGMFKRESNGRCEFTAG